MDCDHSFLDNVAQYQDLSKTDYFFIQNRVRRFTYGGTKHSLTTIEHRKPFFDHALIQFAYGLPDVVRHDGALYRMLLLKAFPEFFRSIPVQSTGLPISWPKTVAELWARSQSRLARLNARLFSGSPVTYTNYPAWLRTDPGRSFLNRLLVNKDVIYPEYIDANAVRSWLKEHDAGANRTKELFRVATIEVWLQQALAGNMRPRDRRASHRIQSKP
jgi:asparagine synthase (glutamine-hydrolysing)